MYCPLPRILTFFPPFEENLGSDLHQGRIFSFAFRLKISVCLLINIITGKLK